MVQKSGSSSVLAEGKPESCGKMLLLEWPVWQLASIHASDPGVKLPHRLHPCDYDLVLKHITAATFTLGVHHSHTR